ncbi:12468_t:CDS:2, partial [Acaulospora colombiana]
MADGSPYVDRYKATASYRPKGYRARRPFLLSNIVTGSIISLFVVGIWAYSIRAVRQD